MEPNGKNMKVKEAREEYRQVMRRFEVQQILDSVLANVPAPKILEAGCGSASHYQFKPSSKLVGIDISREQLDHNKTLSKKIIGDIQTYDLSKFSFDVIICHFVLEHLDDPEKALANFVRGLSHRGIIVIVAPNLFSLVGLVTKFAPFWFHKFARHVFLESKDMKATFKECFRTPFRLSMTPRGVVSFAKHNGLEVRYFRVCQAWATWTLMRRYRFAVVLLKTVKVLVKVLTLGRWDVLLGTYTIVLGRQRDEG